jgi:hypothetical protein
MVVPGHAAGQSPSHRVTAGVEAGARISGLRDEAKGLWGGAALLHVHPRLSLGGAGWILHSRSAIDVASPGPDLEMALGYGGVVADARIVAHHRMAVDIRVLAGAGNAKIIVPVVGSEIGADNFGVLEPEVALTLHLTSALGVKLTGAYLHSFGVEDLPPVLPQDLRAFSAGLSLVVGRR